MLIFCRALSIAVTAIIARRHGEGDVDGMNTYSSNLFCIEFLIYVPLLLICFLNLEHILRLRVLKMAILSPAVWYGRFIVISLIFQSSWPNRRGCIKHWIW